MGIAALRAAGAAALFAVTPGIAAAFTLDGKLTAGDSYTHSYTVGFKVNNIGWGDDSAIFPGTLQIGRDGPSGDIYMLLQVPLEIVDNVYGAPADHDNGWYSHTYSDLKSSDQFQFDLKVGSYTKTVTIDYLDYGPDYKKDLDSTSAYVVDDYATSIQYNLLNGIGDTTNSPDPSGSPPAQWVQMVQYEIALKGEKFPDNYIVGLSDLSSAYLHASPNKLKGDDKITTPCISHDDCLLVIVHEDDETSVSLPAPASGASLLFGLLAARWMRRRRADARV